MEHNPRPINLPVAAMTSGEPLTMSSREIADLVEARHDNVKVTIERLVKRGVIAQPATQDVQETGGNGRVYVTQVYRLDKRSSLIVVAQLCPEFTARLVDRWQQLEEEKAAGGFRVPQTLPEALRLAAEQAEQIEAMKGDVAAHERLVKADGSLSITEAAKNLAMRPKDLFDWLSHNGWIYKRAGSANWLGYQPKCNQGLLEHKSTTVTKADGSEKITEQVRVTAKGLSVLAKLIFPTARQIGGAA